MPTNITIGHLDTLLFTLEKNHQNGDFTLHVEARETNHGEKTTSLKIIMSDIEFDNLTQVFKI